MFLDALLFMGVQQMEEIFSLYKLEVLFIIYIGSLVGKRHSMKCNTGGIYSVLIVFIVFP
jgi:hypothetical protein